MIFIWPRWSAQRNAKISKVNIFLPTFVIIDLSSLMDWKCNLMMNHSWQTISHKLISLHRKPKLIRMSLVKTHNSTAQRYMVDVNSSIPLITYKKHQRTYIDILVCHINKNLYIDGLNHNSFHLEILSIVAFAPFLLRCKWKHYTRLYVWPHQMLIFINQNW